MFSGSNQLLMIVLLLAPHEGKIRISSDDRVLDGAAEQNPHIVIDLQLSLYIINWLTEDIELLLFKPPEKVVVTSVGVSWRFTTVSPVRDLGNILIGFVRVAVD